MTDTETRDLKLLVERGFDGLHQRLGLLEKQHTEISVDVRVLKNDTAKIAQACEAIPSVERVQVAHHERLKGHDRELKDIKEGNTWAFRTSVGALVSAIGAVLMALFTSGGKG